VSARAGFRKIFSSRRNLCLPDRVCTRLGGLRVNVPRVARLADANAWPGTTPCDSPVKARRRYAILVTAERCDRSLCRDLPERAARGCQCSSLQPAAPVNLATANVQLLLPVDRPGTMFAPNPVRGRPIRPIRLCQLWCGPNMTQHDRRTAAAHPRIHPCHGSPQSHSEACRPCRCLLQLGQPPRALQTSKSLPLTSEPSSYSVRLSVKGSVRSCCT
jgi:hypothetical protein